MKSKERLQTDQEQSEREIEDHSIEHLVEYAEVLVECGKEEADVRFPNVATHIKSCSECRSVIASTAASIAKFVYTNVD